MTEHNEIYNCDVCGRSLGTHEQIQAVADAGYEHIKCDCGTTYELYTDEDLYDTEDIDNPELAGKENDISYKCSTCGGEINKDDGLFCSACNSTKDTPDVICVNDRRAYKSVHPL